MKKLYLVRGIPSSGKSDLADDLVGEENTFAADDYFYEKAAKEFPELAKAEGYRAAYNKHKNMIWLAPGLLFLLLLSYNGFFSVS